MNPGYLLPLGAMAAVLGIAAGDLRAAADAGELPCIRLGKRALLFDPELTARLLRERLAAIHAASPKEVPDAP